MRVILLVLFFISSYDSLACSCYYGYQNNKQSIEEAFEGADLIVVASVEDIRQVPIGENYFDLEREITTFNIIETLKGQELKKIETDILTVCCMCGFKFEQEETYLLYLFGPNEDGRYETSICTRSKSVEGAEIELEVLRGDA